MVNLLWKSLYLGGVGERKAVGDATTRLSIPGVGAVGVPPSNMIMVSNIGANIAYIKLGASDVTATVDSFPVLAGQQVYLPLQPQGQTGQITHLAAICDSTEETTLLINSGVAAFA